MSYLSFRPNCRLCLPIPYCDACVRLGQNEVKTLHRDIGFTPNNDRKSGHRFRLLWANNGLIHCNKEKDRLATVSSDFNLISCLGRQSHVT
jgi:hypothetical protein